MSDVGCAVTFGLVLAFFFGTMVGWHTENCSWEGRLVDAPGQVAAIRSRVLAERAELEASK